MLHHITSYDLLLHSTTQVSYTKEAVRQTSPLMVQFTVTVAVTVIVTVTDTCTCTLSLSCLLITTDSEAHTPPPAEPVDRHHDLPLDFNNKTLVLFSPNTGLGQHLCPVPTFGKILDNTKCDTCKSCSHLPQLLNMTNAGVLVFFSPLAVS